MNALKSIKQDFTCDKYLNYFNEYVTRKLNFNYCMCGTFDYNLGT